MNSSEEYKNVIALMKKALEFYADQRNYDGPMGNVAPIDLDEHGSQARFVLNQAEGLIEANRKMQEDYDKLVAAYGQLQTSENKADPQELIKAFKILGNENENL
jgi:hypothetical protein